MKAAIRQGKVWVNGAQVTASDALAAQPGDRLSIEQGVALEVPEDIEMKRLSNWNSLRSSREEAQIRLLHWEPNFGWAVVNKPAGLDSTPWAGSHQKKRLTFQSYLPALVAPPREGTPCCGGPRAVHRLDFRVAGPLIVGSSVEAVRRLKRLFKEQRVHKEYRAICCGHVGVAGARFAIDEPLDGKAAHTDVEVMKVAPCPHWGAISMLHGG
ncbi:unnamed protein product [Effrenium voratum]|nr:unnamed protein product [Effrenium voratum]